jgi:hypothetical protein
MNEGTIHVPKDPMTGRSRRPEQSLADWEKELLTPRTIRIPSATAGPAIVTLPLVDAIAAVQDAGYLVYEIGELPEVREDGNGKPKLPAGWGEQPYNGERSKVEAYYEEAFGKLALARWWEKQEERIAKRRDQLHAELRSCGVLDPEAIDTAEYLVRGGWRRG